MADRFENGIKVADLVLKTIGTAVVLYTACNGIDAYKKGLEQEQRRLIRTERVALYKDLSDTAVALPFAKSPEDYAGRLERFRTVVVSRFQLLGDQALFKNVADVWNWAEAAEKTRDYKSVFPAAGTLANACRNELQREFAAEIGEKPEGVIPLLKPVGLQVVRSSAGPVRRGHRSRCAGFGWWHHETWRPRRLAKAIATLRGRKRPSRDSGVSAVEAAPKMRHREATAFLRRFLRCVRIPFRYWARQSPAALVDVRRASMGARGLGRLIIRRYVVRVHAPPF